MFAVLYPSDIDMKNPADCLAGFYIIDTHSCNR